MSLLALSMLATLESELTLCSVGDLCLKEEATVASLLVFVIQLQQQ